MEKSELSSLQPSADLVNYYRQQICKFEKENEETLQLCIGFKDLISTTALQEERDHLLFDLEELRSAFSDVNIYLQVERQQVTKLLLEIEILKTDLQFAGKKIEILLQLSGLSKEQLQAYYIHSSKKSVKHFVGERKTSNKIDENINVGHNIEETYVQKKLNALKDHFQSSKFSWEEERNCLLEDRRIREAEYKAQNQQYESQFKLLNSKLEDAKKLAYESTKKALEAKSDSQKAQCIWLAEKDKLLMDIKHLQKSMVLKECCRNVMRSEPLTLLYNSWQDDSEVRDLKKQVTSLKEELIDSENLKSLYEGRYRKIQQEFCNLKEENEAVVNIMKDKVQKLKEVKDLYKKQRDKLEERLKSQEDGFSNELKLIKMDLRKVIHQFFKLTNFYSQNGDILDLGAIKDIRLASTFARSVHHSIVEAKKKMLGLNSNYCEDSS